MTTKALVVGSEGRKLTAALAAFDIEVAHVWTPEQAKPYPIIRDDGDGRVEGMIPQDVRLVLLLVDAAPHAKFAGPLKEECELRGISFVSALSKMPQLGRALTLGGFVSSAPESLKPKPADAPPMPEEPTVPAAPTPFVSVEPTPTFPSFDDCLATLKVTLKLMRDSHHVEEVFWSKEHGLNVTRKQSIDTDLD